MDANSIVATASNVIVGENPSYTIAGDFLPIYPQFADIIVPTAVLELYLGLANSCIKYERWKDGWKLAMGWFIAHFATLYLQSKVSPASGASAVIAAGEAKGLIVSKSVDAVSVGIDFSSIAQDLDGWASWKLTTFGIQLASMGKIIGMGGMYVW